MFFKGALLQDADSILVQQTENVQATRQVRFTDVREITEMKTILQAYIHEAINLEKAGLKVNYKKTSEYKMPEELKSKLNKTSTFKTAFYALTPGRQRGYILYFSQPKQSKTRKARIKKCIKQILKGKGLHDNYKKVRNKLPHRI